MRRSGALVVLAVVMAACNQAAETATDATPPDPTTTTVVTTTTEAPTTTTSATAPEDDSDASEEEPTEDLDLDPDLRAIEVVMTEMAFEPTSYAVSAGEAVQFVLRNEGAIEHEFRLTTHHAAEEHIASGHEDHGDEDDSTGHSHDEMSVIVQPGEVDVFTVTFEEAGVFDAIACLLPGHYEAGMHASLTYDS